MQYKAAETYVQCSFIEIDTSFDVDCSPIELGTNSQPEDKPNKITNETPWLIIDGPLSFHLDKRKFRMRFENETEESVDVIILPKDSKAPAR